MTCRIGSKQRGEVPAAAFGPPNEDARNAGPAHFSRRWSRPAIEPKFSRSDMRKRCRIRSCDSIAPDRAFADTPPGNDSRLQIFDLTVLCFRS